MLLPIGISDFRELLDYRNPADEGYIYVDKSLFIKDVLYDGAKVAIITRPRRFGKTLNLSMLQYFFASDVGGKSTKGLFDHLAIAQHPDCMRYQGKHPVVFLSLKDIKEPNYELCLDKIKSIVAAAYKQHIKALFSDKISAFEKPYIDAILQETSDVISLENSIKRLLEFLRLYYGVKPILLIDEYDTPIQQSYLHGYYEQAISFLRNFLSGALKDNVDLEKSVLTGILRISKESLFSDLNNVKVCSILSEQYSQWFGFTQEEVNALLEQKKLTDKKADIQDWFNGYQFGNNLIYNPWSIINTLSENGALKSYWVNTSGNKLIWEQIINASPEIKDKIQSLIAGDAITEAIDEHIVFGDLEQNPAALWSLLLMSGYLKVISHEAIGRRVACELKIPNKEIEDYFRSTIEIWLSGPRGFQWYQAFLLDLTQGNIAAFEDKLQILIEQVLSYHDTSRTSQESFYHGLMLGIVAGLKDNYKIKSNRESGKGRYDVCIFPNDKSQAGIVLEFKATPNEKDLPKEAKSAYTQIKKSQYQVELQQEGVNKIICIGVAFSQKMVKCFPVGR